MTLEEATEIQTKFYDHAACTLDATSAHAFQIGIEAMKREQRKRKLVSLHPDDLFVLLPGESEK